MTVVDERGWGMGEPTNVEVLYNPNAEAILRLIYEAVTSTS
jgi:hypothetical protein